MEFDRSHNIKIETFLRLNQILRGAYRKWPEILRDKIMDEKSV